jgi:acyl dehydratase
MKSIPIDQIKAGDQVAMRRAFSAQDVDAFARVTGDMNPAHLDEAYAAGTMFKTRIVHGMLVASLFSALLGTQLPGLGTIYTAQTLKFLRPVRLDEVVTAQLTVKEINHDRGRVVFDCQVTNDQGDLVVTGEATVLPPRKQAE